VSGAYRPGRSWGRVRVRVRGQACGSHSTIRFPVSVLRSETHARCDSRHPALTGQGAVGGAAGAITVKRRSADVLAALSTARCPVALNSHWHMQMNNMTSMVDVHARSRVHNCVYIQRAHTHAPCLRVAMTALPRANVASSTSHECARRSWSLLTPCGPATLSECASRLRATSFAKGASAVQEHALADVRQCRTCVCVAPLVARSCYEQHSCSNQALQPMQGRMARSHVHTKLVIHTPTP
jgi:hypothetical protein